MNRNRLLPKKVIDQEDTEQLHTEIKKYVNESKGERIFNNR